MSTQNEKVKEEEIIKHDPHAPFNPLLAATISKSNPFSTTFSLSDLQNVEQNFKKGELLQLQIKNRGLCSICFIDSSLKCSECLTVFYCCAEHQKLDWKKHKRNCKEIKSNLNINKEKVQKLLSEAGQEDTNVKYRLPPSAFWSQGLEKKKKYDWLVNCYRMRVEDDCFYGKGKKRGLYLTTATHQMRQCKIAKTWITLDFLLFCKLASSKNVIPQLDWDWKKLLVSASRLLGAGEFTKENAIKLYGSENVFDINRGGRSLRYTAELVYCTCCTNPDWSKDKDYIRIKDEIHQLFPIILPTTISNENMIVFADSEQFNKNIIIKGDEEIFNECGGAIIWKNLVDAITL